MSETDADFLDRLETTPRYNPAYRTLDSDRLFDLARRGVEAADRIEQLEAALRDLLWYTNQLELTVYDPSDWPTEHDEVRNARAALEEERT